MEENKVENAKEICGEFFKDATFVHGKAVMILLDELKRLEGELKFIEAKRLDANATL